MKIIVTGGHHNSALVVAQEFIRQGHIVFWFGHKYSMLGDRETSAEYKEVIKQNITFYPIVAGKFQPKQNFFIHLLRIPVGLLQNIYLFLSLRPNMVYSSGGYVALPTCIIAYLLQVPVFTHEQAVVTGIANRIIALFAKRIYTAFPGNYPYPVNKTLYVGLPIRHELTVKSPQIFTNKRKTIYVTGGKQGSHKINKVLLEALPRLIEKYNIIHQCGSNTIYLDYVKANNLKKTLGDQSDNYLVSEYYDTGQIGSVFQNADLIVGRSGAHTVYELLYLNKPSLLIPIPWTHNDEQTKNALFLVNCQLGSLLEEKDLNRNTFIDQINKMFDNLSTYQRNSSFIPIKNSTELIIKDINRYVKK